MWLYKWMHFNGFGVVAEIITVNYSLYDGQQMRIEGSAKTS